MADDKERTKLIALLLIIGVIMLIGSVIGIDNILLVMGFLLLLAGAFFGVQKYILKKRYI